ncbi:hypothetical protein [Burkholderia cenocepacia]|uniref:hypothetical protein n=1 Tax=Burkholderia cenocepacia TaxID=95486 RepID=UPI00076C1BEC|nr:hypothetical protein [Burkholderia cenocepacia]KWU24725.1 hypothetical protein AS149_31765 [Burkholderia cenocepacia]
MGSFNVTCFASHQTIATGDRCYVMPIIQQASFEPSTLVFHDFKREQYGVAMSQSYADSLWSPYGGFIEATYADAGEIDVLDTAINRFRLGELFARLSRGAARSESGYPTSATPFDIQSFLEESAPTLADYVQTVGVHTRNVDADELFADMCAAWQYLQEAVWEHRVFATDLFGKFRPLEMCVMHADAFAELVDVVEAEQLATGESANRADVLARFLENAPDFLVRRDTFSVDDLVTRTTQEGALGDLLSLVDRSGSMRYPSERGELRRAFEGYRKGQLDQSGLAEALKPTFDARYVLGGLNAFNLRLTPTAWAGDDYINEVGKRYAAFVQAVSGRVCSAREAGKR